MKVGEAGEVDARAWALRDGLKVIQTGRRAFEPRADQLYLGWPSAKSLRKELDKLTLPVGREYVVGQCHQDLQRRGLLAAIADAGNAMHALPDGDGTDFAATWPRGSGAPFPFTAAPPPRPRVDLVEVLFVTQPPPL